MQNPKNQLISSGQRLVRHSLIHEKQIMDEIVLLHPSTGNYYVLNQTGTAVWTYCTEGRKWEEILDYVSRKYQIEKTMIAEEIGSYLLELVEAEILELL